ncbi:SUMF1/EgtB/PvdO family nonheme iron enzyme [Rhodovastum atsumiense]|uniref:SUMF1/EgtB/PvdO family nonheme iron enzyme n=1 Tax=Rhodovastum atsumiense TaxID=504468 RepID=A0A5M6IUU9_9PROT|nr:SUMF1/EgtB/PvdO family nonheme iron enzyme [Rhodovastum atsumiense]KAA5612084.1 SUMF1/EgtB/PvdO family nonheme iron enzyme [Rhodovastum atsumiense]CAH2604042.1 SUMF1/EgtB/PvdO family nonheme iron enzyme [Rhodovastum atsumiense]
MPRRLQGCLSGFVLAVLLACAVLASPWPAAAQQQGRIALVIGIGTYQNAPPLTNPVNDARDIGDALRRLNFDVEELYDPDFRTLTRGLRAFGIRAQRAEAAVVYYAGHGVQVDHENYLLPADARLERERDLLYEALPLSLMLGEVAQAGRIGIVLLDACRNNPFVERIARSMPLAGRAIATPTGLARVDDVPRNTMVMMATRADTIAEDGTAGHSPFAAALLAHLQIPGLELSLFFRSVRDAVLKATANRQEPYAFSSLGAEPFYFYPRPPNRPPVIGAIRPLEVPDSAGPTPLGLPRPVDPDQDPLSVRVIGLPRSGEVRVEGRIVASGEVFSVDRFMTATFKPDGRAFGPVGTLDILVEDGRGGDLTASLPVAVRPANRPPAVEAPRTLRLAPAALGIGVPNDPDGDTLTVTIKALPRGVVRLGGTVLKPGDRLRPEDLARLSVMPEAGLTGKAGSLRYLVEDGRGGAAEGRLDIEVAEAPEVTPNAPATPATTQPAPPPAAPVASVPEAHRSAGQLALAQPPPAAPDRAAPAPASGPAAATAFQDCADCPWLLHVPEGSFTMGQGAREPEASPAHRVQLRGFALGQFPVTIGEWKRCQADQGCRFLPRMAEADEYVPVHNLSWDDTWQYLSWLSRKTGRKYRLPSEAEWEYAARAGTTTRYWWGNEVGVSLANCSDCGGRQETHAPLPVTSFRPNGFGLSGMLGGVAQWTADCWVPNYRGAPADGSAREVAGCLKRVLRGGSFRSGRDDITVTARGNYDASVRYIANGFRVARDE